VTGRGHSSFGERGGPASDARFESIDGIAAGSNGGLYVSDPVGGLLHYVGPDGWISAIAGDRVRCERGEVRAGRAAVAAETPTTADMVCPDGDVAEGRDGSIYVVSYPGIARIRPDGVVTRFAGRSIDAEPGPKDEDGIPATEALVEASGGIAVDGHGTVYVAEGQRIRRIGQDGIITTVAGEPPNVDAPADAPDSGFATADRLESADSVAVAPDGTLYVPDGARIRKVTSPLGGLADRPVSVPSPDGGELWQFDRRGRHLRTVDAITGATIWDFDYDDDGRLAGVKDRSGRTTTIERAGNGDPIAIVAPGGQRTELTLRGDGWLERIENPEDEAVAADYTASGLLRSFTNGEHETSKYEYDGLGRLRTASDPEGGQKTLSTASSELSSTITLTTKQGRATKYVLSRTRDGVTTRAMHYSAGSSVISKTRADGNRETTYSDGTKEVVEYGPDPRFGMLAPMVTKTTVTMPSGLVSTVESTREVTLVNDDPVDGLAAVTDTRVINGDAYVRTYDRAARTLTLTSPEGRENVTKLDALGRAIEVSQGPGRAPVVTTYDDLGRVERIQQGDQFWRYAYHGDTDYVRSRTDARDKTTSYVRDGVGRPTKITLPSGREYDMVYDDAGRLLTTTMPSEEGEPRPQHEFAYSDVGRTEAYTAPGGAAYQTEWSLDGENEGTSLPGRAVKHDFTWGAAGRMQELSYAEANVGFGHDAAGRMTGLSRTALGGSEQALAYGYDGVLQTSATASGPASGQFAYEWTPDHELKKLTLDGTTVHSVSRDDDGLVTGYGPFTFSRTGPSGEATSIAGAGHSIALGFDEAGKLENRTHTRLSQFYDLDLVYDGSGRIESRTEKVGTDPAKTLAYSYDDDGRLVEVRTSSGELVEQYAYDARGNRRSAKVGSTEAQVATYGSDDRLLTRDGVSYTHDAAGFLTLRGQDTFDYSARGELLRANVGGKEVTYAYDGMGRRTARTVGATTTQYLYGSPDDPFQLTATKQGGTLTEYFYDDFGNVFAYRRGGAVFFVGTDQVGSPRVVVNASGQRVRTIEHDSFGNVVATSGTEPAPPIGFAGGLADPDTGLVRFGMRDYDPVSGRWTAKNPLLFEGAAANLYAYAGSNPVNLTDRTGLPSIGASAGVGGYLGVKLGWNDQGFSFCWEFGVGIGGAVEVDPFTETLDEGVRYVAEGQVGVGPAVRGTIGYEYDPLGGPCAEGTGEWKGKGCVVVICAGSDGATVEHPGPDIPADLGQSIKNLLRGGVKGVSAQAKAAVRVCRGGTWD
jgi:RHS repeat-associated protein